MRRGLVSLLALLTLVSAALPLATAQGPFAGLCGPLTITLSQTTGALAPGATGQVTATVENGGQAAATVSVSASTDDAGWRVDPESASASIAGQQSGSFSFNVVAAEGAAASAQVNIVAEGACEAGPLACPPGTAQCRTGQVAETTTFQLTQPEGFRIPGLEDLEMSPELLVGGLLLIAAAFLLPLVARRRRVGFLATCPEPLKMVRPGQGVSFPIEVTNRGKDELTVTFDVAQVPEGWNAFVAMPELHVAPGEKRNLWLMVRAPPAAGAGEKTDVAVRVKAAKGSPVTLRVRAEVDPHASMGSPSGAATPG